MRLFTQTAQCVQCGIGVKPNTITVGIDKVIVNIYKNLEDACDCVLCIYHKRLCALLRCASL